MSKSSTVYYFFSKSSTSSILFNNDINCDPLVPLGSAFLRHLSFSEHAAENKRNKLLYNTPATFGQLLQSGTVQPFQYIFYYRFQRFKQNETIQLTDAKIYVITCQNASMCTWKICTKLSVKPRLYTKKTYQKKQRLYLNARVARLCID